MIEPNLWVAAYFPGPRFDHDTSNVVESMNNTLKLDRELSILDLLDSIWHRVIEERYNHHQQAVNQPEGTLYTPFCAGLVNEGRAWARGNTVQMASTWTARMVQPNGTIFLVDLYHRTCTCLRFQDTGIPCGHAIACIFRVGHTLNTYLSDKLLVSTSVATYQDPIPPFDKSTLVDDVHELCNPPFTRVPKGRPQKERIRPEDTRVSRGLRQENLMAGSSELENRRTRIQRCGTCGETEHNAKTCRRPHQ